MADVESRLSDLERSYHALLDALQLTHHARDISAVRDALKETPFVAEVEAARQASRDAAAAAEQKAKDDLAAELVAKNRAQQGLPPIEATQTP